MTGHTTQAELVGYFATLYARNGQHRSPVVHEVVSDWLDLALCWYERACGATLRRECISWTVVDRLESDRVSSLRSLLVEVGA